MQQNHKKNKHLKKCINKNEKKSYSLLKKIINIAKK